MKKRETSNLNLNRNNVARQVEGFCISYFAALRPVSYVESNCLQTSLWGIRCQNLLDFRDFTRMFEFNQNALKSKELDNIFPIN